MYDTEEQAWDTVVGMAECIRNFASIRKEAALRRGTAFKESPDRDAISEILQRIKEIWETLATTEGHIMLDQPPQDRLT